MQILGYIYYIVSFFSFLISIFIAFKNPEEASVFIRLGIVYIGFCVLWLGWWFKRATCASSGLFYSDEFELEELSDYLYDKTDGKSHSFFWQLITIVAIGSFIYFLR